MRPVLFFTGHVKSALTVHDRSQEGFASYLKFIVESVPLEGSYQKFPAKVFCRYYSKHAIDRVAAEIKKGALVSIIGEQSAFFHMTKAGPRVITKCHVWKHYLIIPAGADATPVNGAERLLPNEDPPVPPPPDRTDEEVLQAISP